MQLKQRRKERLSEVLLAVDGIKTKTNEEVEAEREEEQRRLDEKRLRAEAEAKRKADAEDEERMRKQLNKMTENKGLSKTMQLLSKGMRPKE